MTYGDASLYAEDRYRLMTVGKAPLLDRVEKYLAATEKFLEVAGQEWRDEWFDLSAYVADLRDGEEV